MAGSVFGEQVNGCLGRQVEVVLNECREMANDAGKYGDAQEGGK